jgi:nucleotide-binding universal stress UspA family protein
MFLRSRVQVLKSNALVHQRTEAGPHRVGAVVYPFTWQSKQVTPRVRQGLAATAAIGQSFEQHHVLGPLLGGAPRPHAASARLVDGRAVGQSLRCKRLLLQRNPGTLKTLCAEGAGEIHLIFETGSPARVIADLAADYDLTVIGAKGREDRSRGGGLGPVASAVVNHASGAIYIGRAIRADRGARILVALDGSAASLQAANQGQPGQTGRRFDSIVLIQHLPTRGRVE